MPTTTTRLKSKERPPLQSGFLPALRRFSSEVYFQDYIALFLLSCGITALATVKPFHRLFSLDDRRIQFPHAEIERVPVGLCLLLSALLPLCAICAVLVSPIRSTSSKIHKLQVSLLGLFTSLVLGAFITDSTKTLVGRPRPDLLDRCQPVLGTPEHNLVDWTVCSAASTNRLHDGWRSFPSGHSSFAWGGLGFLTLWLCGQFRVFLWTGSLLKVLCATWPAGVAVYIVVSRTQDYRHDVFDVTAGSAIGIACACGCYRRYFRSLWDRRCDWPYELGEDGEGADKEGFQRVPDMEMEMRDIRMV